MPTAEDAVRSYLAERGASRSVVQGGLEGLVGKWQAFVDEVRRGYGLGLDDYLNDVDLRQLLADALAVLPRAERRHWAARLAEIDAALRPLLVAHERCLWGEAAARRAGWTRRKNWWYYRRPEQAGEELLADLAKRR